MITEENMFTALLEISPAFKEIYADIVADWAEGGEEPPTYIILGKLARYLALLIHSEKTEELRAIFQIIEVWHVEGDQYVREAATIGVLEDLQNMNIVGTEIPAKVEEYFLPVSKRFWFKVYDFWRKGIVITDD